MSFLLALALIFTARASAQVKPPCADLSLPQCREEFTRSNLPAPKSISPDSSLLDPVRDAIGAANKAEERQAAAEAEIERMEAVLSRKLEDDPKQPASIEAILANRRLRDEAVKEKFQQRNLAIERTIQIYGLEPGVKVAPPYAAERPGAVTVVPWQARYSENQMFDPKTGRGRLLNDTDKLDLAKRVGYPTGTKMDYDGGTSRENGQVVIFPHAFDRPELLAATIMHETVHWLELAAKGTTMLPYDSYSSEVKAYGVVIGQATAFGLNATDVSVMNKMASAYARQAQQAPTLTWGQVEAHHPEWLHGASPAPSGDDGPAGRPESIREQGALGFLDSWRHGGEEVAGTVAAGRAATARELETLDDRRRDRERLAERIAELQADMERRFPPYRRSQFYVQALAAEACGDPARLPKLAEAGQIIRVEIARTVSSYDSSDRLSDCQRDVLNAFDAARSAGTGVGSSDFIRWAAAYRLAHPSLIKRLANVFTGFAEVFSGLFDGGGSGSSGTEGSERTERTTRAAPSDGCEYTYIPELNQTVRSCPVN